MKLQQLWNNPIWGKGKPDHGHTQSQLMTDMWNGMTLNSNKKKVMAEDDAKKDDENVLKLKQMQLTS